MNYREAVLRTIHFENPDYIPMVFHINSSCWSHYPNDQLQELICRYSFLFPNLDGQQRIETKHQPTESVGKPFVDGWGCVLQTTENGIMGAVVEHPLTTWTNFDNYVPPDPSVDSGRGKINWEQIAREFHGAALSGQLAMGGLRHGHTFLTLADIRGYENLLLDMADNDMRLWKLIEMVEYFNEQVVRNNLAAGAEWMSYPEDLGMQSGPMISPCYFRKYIKPSYQRLMSLSRDAGCIVHMHSDGDIKVLVDDLLEGGAEVINLQDAVNGIDWIKHKLVGKTCIDLDVDRQNVTRFGTPEDIDKFILHEIKTLGCKQGGLMMIYGLYPGVPIENVEAIMNAMHKYATYYS